MLGGSGIGWVFALVWARNTAHHDAACDGTEPHTIAARATSHDSIGPGTDSRIDADMPSSLADAVRQIERLGRLKAEGHLSNVEFVALKVDVLKRL